MPYGLPEAQRTNIPEAYARGRKQGAEMERIPIMKELDELKLKGQEQALQRGQKQMTLQDYKIQDEERKSERDLAIDMGKAAEYVLGQPPELQAQEFERAKQFYGDMGIDVSQATLEDLPMLADYGRQAAGGEQGRYGRIQAGLKTDETGVETPVFFQGSTGQAGYREVPGITPMTTGYKAEEAGAITAAKETEKLKAQIAASGELTEIAVKKAEALGAAKARSEGEAEEIKTAKTIQDIFPSLERMEKLADEGIYTGNLAGQASQWLSKKGIVLDQEKLNRTTRVRQIATRLKLDGKPTGMGAMSDSEWDILAQMIPDPESATVEQLMAGIKEFRLGLEDRLKKVELSEGVIQDGYKFLGGDPADSSNWEQQ